MKRLLIFGFGFTGRVFAARMQADGWDVWAAVRSEASAEEARAAGVTPIDSRDQAALVAAPPMTAILVTSPPTDHGCPALEALVPAIARAGAFPDWIGYLSTTGVYGDREGGWCFETTPLHARSIEAGRRVAAERDWLEVGRGMGLTVQIFRLPGIYGPGRSPLERLRERTVRNIVKPGQVFSRIHVEDIASVLEASIANPEGGGVYNVCDDDPAPPQDVIAYACALLGVEAPPEVPYAIAEKSMSEMARSFYAENKRVMNRKIKDTLGVKLAYPDYRAGLKALLEAGA